ncbi:dirigent protein 21-like [Coffea eugenioides]|uniref:dirigent protein 21-like n=1 Tax=Coffea eugenioides TaxID=49369 RepID=UPI000F615A40|nr:dirigent protein 21-like [Coffea eugenioides]
MLQDLSFPGPPIKRIEEAWKLDKLSMKMKKMKLINAALLWWVAISIAMPSAYGSVDQSPKAVEKWFKELRHGKEKLTKLHFYLHDTVTTKNPTTVQVAQANMTSKSPTLFGETVVLDDPLTVGPEPSSKIIGHAQGIYSSVSQEGYSQIMILNLIFNYGKFNGSTLSLLGSNPIFNEYREMPILGGTGAFRLARGIATEKSYAVNVTTKNAIAEHHVLVLHY